MPLINPDRIGWGLIKIFTLEILALAAIAIALFAF